MAALLVVLQVLTGILLKFQYLPSVDQAYQSIVTMQQDLVFGRFVRNIHHWSGQFIVVITVLHLARIIFTTAYFPPRRVNWFIGLGLLALVLVMNFTGYLLPWNQLSYWAITIASSMLDYIPVVGKALKVQILGGNHVGQATLMNFYNFHTGILPAILVILMAYHFWKVRKAKGVILPSHSQNNIVKVPVIPNLVVKELVTGLVLLASILLFSLLINAPLMEKADPSTSPNPAKAPWYFLGIQELIVHIHPYFSVFLVPILLLAGSILFPYAKKQPVGEGIWFASGSVRKTLLKVFIFTILFIPLWIIADEYLLHFGSWMPEIPYWISEGIVPLIIFTIISFLSGIMILERYRQPYNVLIMSAFVFFGTAYIILMITGIFFRGPGMELILPFN
jgi:quinol-cytochrome oxidoreductase complex cytochrome b subunit